MENQGSGKTVRLATACTECQRRKQKCSREWPCNHCQSRRIAHLCKFTPKKVLKAKPASNERTHTPTNNADAVPDFQNAGGVASGEDFRMLGYLPDNLLKEGPDQYQSAVISPNPQGTIPSELEKAIRTLPPKPYTDMLVQHFLSEMNEQYYCLYPPTFLHDYAAWWSGKASGQSLAPEFTALLLQVCACATLYLDVEAMQRLESELGENSHDLAEQYHRTANQLSSTMSPGKGGLTQVQQLFINAVWYKTEALFIESWHALSAAIHEAQELGMHRSPAKAKVSEFEREMRRRIWCLLYTWDWQMSLLLSRPFIINSNYCSFELPNVRLETADAGTDMPSPVTHIALQSQLGLAISKIPGVMSGILSPNQAIAIQQEIERWFEMFPPAYRRTNPDTRWDHSHRYVPLQRHQLYAVSYMVMFMPLKQCLTIDADPSKPSLEKSLQPAAVDCATKVMDSARALLAHMLPASGKFHFAPFLIFDTAAFLCSAIIHDRARNLAHRDKALETIGIGLDALEQISQTTKAGATCYSVLARLTGRMPLSPEEKALLSSRTPEGSLEGPQTPPSVHAESATIVNVDAYDVNFTSSDILGGGMDMALPAGLDPSGTIDGLTGLDDILSMDMGEFSQIWDWDNLDLNNPGLYDT
ncbi:uncharacterized protein BO80DRAFT_428451 [Aspergillus ibericus CBS 121593]|uniref:Zn(2)-C6 fungal-type domain-containing protein n=1 Tax=Aspergillus ibericus CBS 121593 TaxID=1448316 RepID=A0A395GNQ2_9EURO|nr:hypothetical protein BO80DRAFT_428451 [Aspergillus ibericus CBS 121593]RAK97109.1 hypothetical protein BO80DRAFT_428451 [Aspergillus ibericus CBS 121593]